MAPDVSFKDFEGKDVTVALVADGEGFGRDIAGKLIKVGVDGSILVKNKGTHQVEFYERHEFVDIQEASMPSKGTGKILIREVAEVTEASVRQHLADRHGLRVDDIPYDLTAALVYHTLTVQHEHLGHRHINKRTPQERAADLANTDNTTVIELPE